ncbi:DNA alkylation repair protein [Gluconobacter oxydans]|uniref:DNA alkylation repair protein n=1 Tax=Gluconobacter thailandicus TaxID=257438 RepID=UPI0003647465|nr:DNA alkylation repair protein [Gluconobacter thailandicus]ANQ40175.1 DNA alkylation repair protein [Gluconobacter oxydans]
MTLLRNALLEELLPIGDPERAKSMQRYMKSSMPYLGVPTVPLKKVCKKLFSPLKYDCINLWHDDVLNLWRRAEYREERYAAITLSGVRAADIFQTIDSVPMYEEMIVSGAWWDYVDEIAIQRLSKILVNDRASMARLMREWSMGEHIWKRRCSILIQNRSKGGMDLELLYDCIRPSLSSKEFFLRKAIGWALRELAWTNPDEVRRYVAQEGERLSTLSRREALKNLKSGDNKVRLGT